jgi:hypothetical protein
MRAPVINASFSSAAFARFDVLRLTLVVRLGARAIATAVHSEVVVPVVLAAGRRLAEPRIRSAIVEKSRAAATFVHAHGC